MKLTELFQYCPRCGKKNMNPTGNFSTACTACGFEIFANAAAAAAALIWNKRKEILFVVRKHNPCKGMLDLPGGFVSPGEIAEESLRREIFEELGLELGNICYSFSFPNRYDYKGLTVETLDFFFESDYPENQVITCGDDAESAQFYSLEDIPKQKIAFSSVTKAVEYLKRR